MRKVIPLGNRLLVKRRRIGETLGSGIIVASEATAERPTDLADVVYTSEWSAADKELIENSEAIVKSLTESAKEGDAHALETVMKFNDFIKRKSIVPGDTVMISKYVGTDFLSNETQEYLTLVNDEDIIGIVHQYSDKITSDVGVNTYLGNKAVLSGK